VSRDLRNLNAEIFNVLSTDPPKWWVNIKDDEDLTIQVRKDNTIDVYYNGGGLLSGLKYINGQFTAKIHHKFIPLRSGRDYVNLKAEAGPDKEMLIADPLMPISLGTYSDAALIRKYKKLIEKYCSDKSEKGIQYAFIRNDGYFIDSEYQWGEKANENETAEKARIDLIRIDSHRKQIVFVEVKTIGDERLYDKRIVTQLTEYHEYLVKRKNEILDHVKFVIDAKTKIGVLGKRIKEISGIGNYTLCLKPLLLMGDCTNQWIKNNTDSISESISSVAAAAFYFGKPEYNCDIKDGTHRHIFIDEHGALLPRRSIP